MGLSFRVIRAMVMFTLPPLPTSLLCARAEKRKNNVFRTVSVQIYAETPENPSLVANMRNSSSQRLACTPAG
eukprot:9375495-Pyramimonas_sp.AAC.1